MRKLTFIILCLEGAILSFNVAASAALVPSIARDFATTEFLAGRIVWLYMLPYGLAALLYGPLVRSFDAKRVELVCFFLFSLANLLAGFASHIYALYAARVLMGVFGASVIPLVLILISQHSQPHDRGKRVGLFFSATFVASLIGLFLSGIIPWRLIYLYPALAGFVLWFAMYRWLPAFEPTEKKFRLHYRQALTNKTLVSLFVYIFVISLLYHGVQQWLAVYFSSERALRQFAISMLITLTSLSGIAGEAVGGWLSDAAGRIRTVNTGIVLMIASLTLLLFRIPVSVTAFVMVLWGLGWTLNHAGVSTLLTDLPKEHVNEAASLNSSVRFLAGGLGVAVAGPVMEKSFSAGFMASGACLLLLLVCTRYLLKPYVHV